MNTQRAPMTYPFITRRDVLARLSRDPAFVRECIEVLHRRFMERATLEPPAGWMSSHRVLGESLHARLAGEDCNASDVARAGELAKRYAKQLTRVLRDEQIARDPRLGLAAAVFGVTPSQDVDSAVHPEPEPSDEAGATGATGAERHTADTPSRASVMAEQAGKRAPGPPDSPARRPRGRPRGSKNKPKDAAPPRKAAGRRRR